MVTAGDYGVVVVGPGIDELDEPPGTDVDAVPFGEVEVDVVEREVEVRELEVDEVDDELDVDEVDVDFLRGAVVVVDVGRAGLVGAVTVGGAF